MPNLMFVAFLKMALQWKHHHGYSRTGQRIVHAFTMGLVLSNSWNFADKIGVKATGTIVFASKMVVSTMGGTSKDSLPWKTGEF